MTRERHLLCQYEDDLFVGLTWILLSCPRPSFVVGVDKSTVSPSRLVPSPILPVPCFSRSNCWFETTHSIFGLFFAHHYSAPIPLPSKVTKKTYPMMCLHLVIISSYVCRSVVMKVGSFVGRWKSHEGCG